jgi:molecular chaperone DnaJ
MICIDGQKINIRVPAGSQPNNRLVVRGKGMPVQPNSAQRGDLHVEILITIPTNLSPEAIATIKTLKN